MKNSINNDPRARTRQMCLVLFIRFMHIKSWHDFIERDFVAPILFERISRCKLREMRSLFRFKFNHRPQQTNPLICQANHNSIHMLPDVSDHLCRELQCRYNYDNYRRIFRHVLFIPLVIIMFRTIGWRHKGL